MTLNALHLPRRRAPQLRLTMRGRRVLATVLMIPVGLGIGAGVVQIPAAIAGDDAAVSGPREQFQTRTVMAGETLWSIANDITDGRDARDVVDDLIQLNNLATASLQAGQQLALPNY